MVLAVTTSPAFALPESMVLVKITGIAVSPGSVSARPAGTNAVQPRTARERAERIWVIVVNLLKPFTTAFEHSSALQIPDVFLTFSLHLECIGLQACTFLCRVKAGLLNILLIEDERKLADAVAEGLQGEGYAVTLSPTGEDALSSIRRLHYDLILLDLMLPARSGLEGLGDFRKSGLSVPVLILTSRDSIEDRVLGLDAGADDYLV